MHRVMAREKHRYIQQICTYVGSGSYDQRSAGRLFPAGTGLMGKALSAKRVLRTKPFDSVELLDEALSQDLVDTGSTKKLSEVGKSFLAVPFIGSDERVVLVLYADTKTFGFFADNKHVQDVVDMCDGFRELLDWISKEQPFQNLRNFLTPEMELKASPDTAFPQLYDEYLVEPPQFSNLSSFNFESTSS